MINILCRSLAFGFIILALSGCGGSSTEPKTEGKQTDAEQNAEAEGKNLSAEAGPVVDCNYNGLANNHSDLFNRCQNSGASPEKMQFCSSSISYLRFVECIETNTEQIEACKVAVSGHIHQTDCISKVKGSGITPEEIKACGEKHWTDWRTLGCIEKAKS